MDEKQLYIRLGRIISHERQKRKLSQERLAFLTGIDKTFISRIERGKTNVTVKILNKIAKIFRAKISEFFTNQ